MRDPNRIKSTLESVEKLWRMNTDFRLGQLMWLIAGRDPFFIEDDEVIRIVEEELGK